MTTIKKIKKAKKLYKENKKSLVLKLIKPYFQNIYRAENDNIIIMSVGRIPFANAFYLFNKRANTLVVT